MNNNRIAVLLAAYNGIGFIEKQIETILFQKSVYIELFISVDKSDDATLAFCKKVESGNQNVHVLAYGERFGGAAKNFFRLFRDVNFSDFDYVSLADQDDIWDTDKLIQAINKIESEKVDAYSSNVTAFWNDGRRLLIDKSKPQKEYDFLFEAAGPGCTYVITIKIARDFQLFLISKPQANKFILHDWLLYAFARTAGYKWFIDPISYMDYRQHESNQVGVNNSCSAFLKRVKYILLEGGVMQVGMLLELLPPNDNIQDWKGFSVKAKLNMMMNFNHLRRKPIERVYVLFALFISLFWNRKTQ